MRDAIVQHGLTLLRPAEVAALVLDVVAGGDTGQAWETQAGRDPDRSRSGR